MKTFWKLFIIFLFWRLALFLIGFLADSVLTYDPSFPYADGLLDTFDLPRWVYSWANFDGVHYLTIMKNGYRGADLIQAFFPVYPYLSKIVNFIVDNYLLASLVVSNVSFLLLLFFWYQCIKHSFSQTVAYWATAVLLLFPTSFFFAASYTESLFLLFVIGTFWSVQKKRYWLTALCIALASATRVTGILLLPAVLIEIVFPNIQWGISLKELQKNVKNSLTAWRKVIQPVGIVALGSAGLLAYMYYLYKEFGDPLYFFHVQSEFGGGIRQESVVLYPQVVWRYIKILLTARPFDLKYYSYILEFLVGIFGLLGIVLSVTKTRLSCTLFALLAFFVPTITGTFSSMPRYILVCFPIFSILAIWAEKSKVFRYTWFTMSIVLLIVHTVMFVQGYWIA
ncbi:MAG: hypothetical protein BroJett025_05080 [Patescibacteria group bacterium]|nr:MAG: hypothetical protein BroJett025_05080 [Patescibacteria group bacterium]